MFCGVTESFTGALFARSETVLPAEPIENFHLGALDRALARFQASAGVRKWGSAPRNPRSSTSGGVRVTDQLSTVGAGTAGEP